MNSDTHYPSPPPIEALASDAIERMAHMLGVTVDMDDPEPALVGAVERAIHKLSMMKVRT